MTIVIAAFEFGNVAAFAAIVVSLAIVEGIIRYWRRGPYKRLDENIKLLARQTRELQRQVDVIIQHQGIEMPPPPASFMSPEVARLAQDPKTKLAAIKLYLDENPGTSLREANDLISAMCKKQ